LTEERDRIVSEQVEYFEDIEIGDELEELEICPTTEDVQRYVVVARMNNPRFTDDVYAKGEGLPGAIIPGNMSLGFLSRMVAEFFPLGRVVNLTANFRATVPHNVPLICGGVVTEKQEKDGENLVFCDLQLTNEDGDRYVQGTAQVALPKRD
jgi:acyl dehydratase